MYFPLSEGTSSSTAVLPLQSTRKRRAVDPLPLMGVEAQPASLVQQAVPAPAAPPQSPLPAPAEPQDELQEADFYAPASPPTLESTVLAAADNVIPPPDATIQLDLSDITPDAAEGQMEMSPHHYSVPDDFNVDVQEEEADLAGASMCRVILERLTALEAAQQSDRRVDAMEALTHLLEGCEEGRRADMKKVISCLTTLAAAVAGQTEQQRLSSDKLGVSVEKLVNAVSEQTVALRQMQASAVVAALAVPPTTPSASTSATASQCSETPQEPTQSPARGLRRQRGGRRGRK